MKTNSKLFLPQPERVLDFGQANSKNNRVRSEKDRKWLQPRTWCRWRGSSRARSCVSGGNRGGRCHWKGGDARSWYDLSCRVL